MVLEKHFELSSSVKPVCLPNKHNNVTLHSDEPLNIGRGVTRDSSREYLEKLVASTVTENNGESTTHVHYMSIQQFLTAISMEIRQHNRIL